MVVGGQLGLAPEVQARAQLCLSLGAVTLPHELAAVVALEQLYRAHTILAGLPYHRGLNRMLKPFMNTGMRWFIAMHIKSCTCDREQSLRPGKPDSITSKSTSNSAAPKNITFHTVVDRQGCRLTQTPSRAR
jgi:hypothetical protein